MKKKIILCIGIVLILIIELVVLAGCGNGDSSSSKSSQSNKNNGTEVISNDDDNGEDETSTKEPVSSGSNENSTTLKIGDTVNYTTTLNGVTLNNWKVFYVDGDYTYIILDDYLPNEAVDTTNIAGLSISGTYCVYSKDDRTELLNAMTTKSNWDSLLTGTINGHAVNEKRSSNVYAMGAPTVDLWVNSWNATYPNDKLYTATTVSAMSDGLNGYYIGDYANPSSRDINFSSKTGHNNTLYFPHQGYVDDCCGYWLASPSASLVKYVMKVWFCNYVNSISYDYNEYAFRPVVCLPSSVVNQ